MPRCGLCLSSRRRSTRPFSRPITGSVHAVTARSINRSIRVAVLVMSAPEYGCGPSIAACAWRSWSWAGGEAFAHPVGERVAAVPLARLDELAGEPAPDDRLHALRRLDQRVEVHAGLRAHRVQAVDQVLGAHVPGGAGREGTTAEPADGGVDVGHPVFHSGQDVR